VCLAAEVASAREMKVLALTGEAGGPLSRLADVCIRVPAQKTHLVQEYHLPVYHCLSLMLEDEFFA
jgi:D-sedoheptulose 7-phosphate isomerase